MTLKTLTLAGRCPYSEGTSRALSHDDLTMILHRTAVSTVLANAVIAKPETHPTQKGLSKNVTRYPSPKIRHVRWRVLAIVGVLTSAFVIMLAPTISNLGRLTASKKNDSAEVADSWPKLAERPRLFMCVQEPEGQTWSAQPTHRTAVNFLATPTDAAREARKNNKLTFLLHISGNFEDGDFT